MSSLDDKMMIELIRKNPTEGLRTVIDQYSPLVTAVVGRVLHGNKEDAEECVADTFVKFWETAQKLDPQDSSVKAYLICIARNLAINRYNYVKRRRSLPLDDSVDAVPDGDGIESEVLQSESIDIMLEAVEDLEEPNREIMIRRYFFFEPVKEIARRLGFTDSMVANRIRYSKLQLRKKLVMKGVSL